MKVNKMKLAEELAEQLECSFEATWDLVYDAEFICDENETDDAM